MGMTHVMRRYKSPRKAVMFACFIIGMGLYLILAGTIQERLTRAVRLCEQVSHLPWLLPDIARCVQFSFTLTLDKTALLPAC